MEHVDVDDVEPSVSAATLRRPVADALECGNMRLNYYELTPGDSFAFGYHKHGKQEEVFYVLEGRATFETEEGSVAVEAGEAIRFAPGEYQRGVNEGDARVVALGIGAPAELGDSEMLRECPECGERTPNELVRTDDGLATVCEECGAETGRFTA